MPKYLIGPIALLLIACLWLDAALAATPDAAPAVAAESRVYVSMDLALCSQQALAGRAVTFMSERYGRLLFSDWSNPWHRLGPDGDRKLGAPWRDSLAAPLRVLLIPTFTLFLSMGHAIPGFTQEPCGEESSHIRSKISMVEARQDVFQLVRALTPSLPQGPIPQNDLNPRSLGEAFEKARNDTDRADILKRLFANQDRSVKDVVGMIIASSADDSRPHPLDPNTVSSLLNYFYADSNALQSHGFKDTANVLLAAESSQDFNSEQGLRILALVATSEAMASERAANTATLDDNEPGLDVLQSIFEHLRNTELFDKLKAYRDHSNWMYRAPVISQIAYVGTLEALKIVEGVLADNNEMESVRTFALSAVNGVLGSRFLDSAARAAKEAIDILGRHGDAQSLEVLDKFQSRYVGDSQVLMSLQESMQQIQGRLQPKQ